MNARQGDQLAPQGGKVDQQERDIEWSEDLQLSTDGKHGPAGIGVPAQRAEGEVLGPCRGKTQGQMVAQGLQAKSGPQSSNALTQLVRGLLLLFVLGQRGLVFSREFSSQGHRRLPSARSASR